MTRRIPVVPTLVVLAAVATMIALGFWQLSRLREKEALLARYHRAYSMNSDVAWPTSPEEMDGALYRHARIECMRVEGIEARAGASAKGQSGWSHIAHCILPDGANADVAIGWSDRPASPAWPGGEVGGIVAKAGKGVRLVASPAMAGLGELAHPDPGTIPNNHLSYAVQWFLFAGTAVVIYALALRKRWRTSAT